MSYTVGDLRSVDFTLVQIQLTNVTNLFSFFTPFWQYQCVPRQLMHLIPHTYSRLHASNSENVLAENAFYIDVVFCRHLQLFLFYG
jgi:hypothetical protein